MLTIYNWPGLMDAINAAGYRVDQHDNNLIGVKTSDGTTGAAVDSAIEAVVSGYPVGAAADVVCQQIEALATAKRNAVVAPFSPGEMSSWPIKLAEARQFGLSANPADAPFLAREAAKRGVTLQQLADKVIANAAQLSAIEADIAGVNGMHRDAVRALTTHEQVLTYDYTTGWPL